VFSHGDTDRNSVNPSVKTLGTTGFQFRPIFCVQKLSEITLTYLEKNVPQFKENKSQVRAKRLATREAARDVNL